MHRGFRALVTLESSATTRARRSTLTSVRALSPPARARRLHRDPPPRGQEGGRIHEPRGKRCDARSPANQPREPLHAAEGGLRHRAVDDGGLLGSRERGGNPAFEGGHLRRRFRKERRRSVGKATAAVCKAGSSSTGKAVRRAGHTGQHQHRCEKSFHDRIPCAARPPNTEESNRPSGDGFIRLASIAAVLSPSGRRPSGP